MEALVNTETQIIVYLRIPLNLNMVIRIISWESLNIKYKSKKVCLSFTVRNIALPKFPTVKVPIGLKYPRVGMDTLNSKGDKLKSN